MNPTAIHYQVRFADFLPPAVGFEPMAFCADQRRLGSTLYEGFPTATIIKPIG